MKRYVLPLARSYCAKWGLKEAIRELLQNAIDGGEWTYTFHFNGLSIHSPKGYLDPKTLVLGTTSKADDKDSIGSFGEGYKIALLVLSRLGLDVSVYNQDVCWTPAFVHDKNFDCEVLCIEEQPWNAEGLEFVVDGLTVEQTRELRETCLQMQDLEEIGEVVETPYGQILLDRHHQLFVNGLFVCETQTTYGYNVKPEFLQLERDRQTVSGFNLQWLLKDMWVSTRKWDKIAAMIAGEVYDVELAHAAHNQELDEACARHFAKEQPGKTIAATPQEVSTRPTSAYYSRNMHACVSRAPSYQAKLIKPKTPADLLQDWLEVNKKHMRHRGVKAFSQLVKDAKNWSR